MSPFLPMHPVPTAVSPRRRPRVAFIDPTPADSLPTVLQSHPPDPVPDINDMVITPQAFSSSALSSSSASLDTPRWTFAPTPAARTIQQLQQHFPHPQQQEEEEQQEQAMVSFNLKDKMGLFLSVCSVLVSIHMFTPKVM